MNSSELPTVVPPEIFPCPEQAIADFISDESFPCVGAKSALNRERIHFADYRSLENGSSAADLCQRLEHFSKSNPDSGSSPTSFVAIFSYSGQSEVSFETSLWNFLQKMHDHDRANFAWDATVGSDASQSDFSFSIAGRAFFVVGLHPGASRISRRAPFPCLVFNFHNQFESMKATGKYQSMQAVIRSRDLQLQGSINPVLARFGEASEARQYAGRAVDAAWNCPFHTMDTGHVQL